MSDEYTVDTYEVSETLRVRIVADLYPHEPYDDGGSPIIRLETRSYGERVAEQVEDITSYRVHERILDAFARWGGGGDDEALTRYLRAFHGVTRVETYSSPDGDSYATCDPAEWRETVGAPEGSVSLEEWRAYCEGDCYGIITERLVTWTTPDLAEDEATRQTWETEDSTFGFYGITYAREEAERQVAQLQAEVTK